MKTVDFSETIEASDLKVSRSRHLIEYIKVVSIEGQFLDLGPRSCTYKNSNWIISSPEPSGSQGELIVYPWSVVRRRPSSVHIFQTFSPQKPLGRSKPNFMWSLLGEGERKFI